jgi:hypothetical protein
VTDVIGPDEDEFLRVHSRTFLLATRADGSPTGWPMVGLYRAGTLEFSTYGRSRKVVDLQRNPDACCVVAPDDSDRALVLRGRVAVDDAQHEPTIGGDAPPGDVRVSAEIGERARARMRAGKRLVLKFTPTAATFIPGWRDE